MRMCDRNDNDDLLLDANATDMAHQYVMKIGAS